MKYDIYCAEVCYGGSLNGNPEFKLIHKNVNSEFVHTFFSAIRFEPDKWKTPSDSMGSYEVYRVEVSVLWLKTFS